MNRKVLKHFKKTDPVLYTAAVKAALGERTPRSSKFYFEDLVESIVSQQLSGKAASTIYERFKKLLPKGKITAESILKVKGEDIRTCGVSNAKVSYIKDLAQKIKSKEVHLEKLAQMKDGEIIEELTKVKGIGRWTAEMFLMFTLNRPDVFSHGDLGLNSAIKRLYKLENPTKEEIAAITIKWSPYRTFASRVLWKSLDAKG
ncbi:MAG: hypothetical protein A3H88_00975 [Candidatus Blackburnbacteria bacterium RIFCSPLOWO2_02_FULL_44_9]|uniref:DNA-3-methyladenine glycosylase II n=1 Tax=Candidatus Blackburnbacteria bacterium RIFCSPHIGHO2_02_FULL_44_20 TaxID=1797516 RepID=A0A1G1V957_9BACT|nr:MAG: hypothetical protein A3E16_01680 [Candidatus Blackburnbacteria bacterium RIFCSPHIGHO2_12_FULL_44_25]OGY11949.1 MAG: hypothetical protein A3D26_03090 [Candidatus Blackburnbacteria bacterium RIFCSPHIGHO2_02_FULL_44_20]OGY13338.1 MAG: hypothetical protein A3A62_03545 [Candidatus Blackburnbacteria bacterium RIFCSPLOWO2_01_FULL_44_43]OGY15955.1 MAG: hypothetical protein A3H88_00975 [Candidatus Blackburnbacteria bacterium RIFCSPLOWO2_02_FULL_44_9]